MKSYWVIISVCGLLLTGCGEKETLTSPELSPATEVKPTAVEQVKQSADIIAKQATEMVDTGVQLVKETADDAKQTIKKVVETAAVDAKAVTEVGKQKTAEFVGSTKQKVIEVKEQLQQEETQLLDNLQKTATATKTIPLPNIASESKADIRTSETLVIENKKGNVTLSHAEHGKLYGCASCHGDAVPGVFELGKDAAHGMCKGCHKEQGGPTKCSGCHKK